MTAVRRVPTHAIHLTFDDGPVPGATDRVLDALEAHGATATFFVIVERARRERALLNRIVRSGHRIGSHSLDHRYGNFFSSDRKLRTWIERAHGELSSLIGEAPVGFRSPAGVRTPPLTRVLSELGIPLVLWNVRFFDAVIPWRESRAKISAERIEPGSIVLLHDVRVGEESKHFAKALHAFLTTIETRKLPARALSPSTLAAALTSPIVRATVRT